MKIRGWLPKASGAGRWWAVGAMLGIWAAGSWAESAPGSATEGAEVDAGAAAVNRTAGDAAAATVSVAEYGAGAGQGRRLMIADFEQEEILGVIKPTAGVAISLTEQDAVSGQRSLEVRVGRFSEHGNQWPYISFGPEFFTEPADYSSYSKISMTIRNVTEGLANTTVCVSTLPYNDSGQNLEYKTFIIPGGTSMVCDDPFSGFRRPMNDPSAIGIMILIFPAREIEAIYRIDKIEAVYNPAEGSPADSLLAEAQQAQQQLPRISEQVNWAAVAAEKAGPLRAKLPELAGQIQEVLAGAQAGQAQGFGGKLRALQDRLKGLSRQMSEYVLADKQGFYVWRAPGYKFVFRDDFPDLASEPVETLEMAMALNEFRHTALMVSACGSEVQLEVKLETPAGMPAAAMVVQRTEYYPYLDKEYGDALFAVEGPLAIPAQEAREIWLRFDSRWSGLKPGEYDFTVQLRDAVSGRQQAMAGKLTVWDFRLVSYDVLPNNAYVEFHNSEVGAYVQDEAVRHMKMYGVNMVYFLGAQLPWPVTVDEQGRMTGFDATSLRQQVGAIVRAWKSAPGEERLWWTFALNAEPVIKTLIDSETVKYPSEAWQAVFGQWLKSFKEALRQEGLADEDWMLVLGDEASESALLTGEMPLAEIIKGVDPRIQLACNTSTVLNDPAQAQRFFRLFDYLQPCLDTIETNPYLEKWIKDSGKPRWTYRCSNTIEPGINLYEYFRVYGWKNYRYGFTGTGMWTYCAQAVSPWGGENDRAKQYNLVFKHKDKSELVHSRRYEYYREGLDDYRYLITFRELARQRGGGAEQRAEQMIQQAMEDILADVGDDRRCEKWRVGIAEEILKLPAGQP